MCLPLPYSVGCACVCTGDRPGPTTSNLKLKAVTWTYAKSLGLVLGGLDSPSNWEEGGWGGAGKRIYRTRRSQGWKATG